MQTGHVKRLINDMKTIKIRYINRNHNGDYLIQRKTKLGLWKYITYTQWGGGGEDFEVLYCEDTKEELLTTILERYYCRDKRFTKIIEYPEIKHY